MMEWGTRERNLLSGLVVQVVFIGIIVFLFTQAVRQLRYQHSEYLELKKQIKACRLQAAKGKPELTPLESEVSRLKGQFATAQDQSELITRLELLARKQFDFDDLETRLSKIPKRLVKGSEAEGPPLPVETLTLQLDAKTTTRNVAGLLASLSQGGIGILCPLRSMKMKTPDLTGKLPVQVHLEWIVPLLVSESVEKKEAGPKIIPAAPPQPILSWGLREEPFLSPFLYAGVLKTPVDSLKGMRLAEVQWEGMAPVCLINGKIVRLNDRVGDYQLVLVTPRAVLLQGEEGELFLPLK